MTQIFLSKRVKEIEQKWQKPLIVLFKQWHWNNNLMHKEIALKVGVSRPTITRWFHQFKIPTQSCFRFTNLNLLNTGPRKTPPAKPKIKREFPWKYNKEFFNKWSNEMAYVLGFICSDGYVYRNPRGSNYLGFISTDKEIIEKIKKTLNSNHKIGFKDKSAQNKNWKKSYVLQIGGKQLVNKLKEFGIVQNKSLTIKFPDVPKKYIGAFVRGYFDGDGCAHFKQYFKKDRNKFNWVFTTDFTSGSKKFLIGLWKNVKTYTKGGYLNKKNGGYTLVFSRHDSVALFRLMYNNVSSKLFLERKYNTFLKAFRVLKYNIAGVA
ncbi:MAG: LAGLIDADG family homing endonuclease [Minisyncoccia bacterium]